MPDTHFNPQSNFVSSACKPSTKYKNFEAEVKQVQNYLSHNIGTQTMAAVALDIYRPNLCRHVAKLRKQNLVAVVTKSKCRITGFVAEYLTCNQELIKRLAR